MTAPRPLGAVCVYCASSAGSDPVHVATATAVGRLLGTNGITLVFGGGAVGLMGAVADGCLAVGGSVVGIIPTGLFQREVAHRGVTELVEVASMHERKRLMFERADAFVALPGGLGTLEELAEVATWAQLGIHRKPIAVLDSAGYWSGLRQWLDHAVHEGLLKADNRALISWVERVDELLEALRSYDVPFVEKWLDPTET